MTPPLWKKYLSYLMEWHIESAPSEHNPHLYVSLRNGRYQLCTANAIYSYEDLYDNFSLAFKQMDLDKITGNRVLILGLGLGSVPFILEKTFQKNYHYTAVEIDESVLYLANKYTLPHIQSPIEMICADAFAYVMQSQEQFDLIAMDVFLDDVIPEQFQQTAFLEQINNLLTPTGVLLYNRLACTEADILKTEVFYNDYFKAIFPNGISLDVRGNRMLVNTKSVLKN